MAATATLWINTHVSQAQHTKNGHANTAIRSCDCFGFCGTHRPSHSDRMRHIHPNARSHTLTQNVTCTLAVVYKLFWIQAWRNSYATRSMSDEGAVFICATLLSEYWIASACIYVCVAMVCSRRHRQNRIVFSIRPTCMGCWCWATTHWMCTYMCVTCSV